MKLSLSFEIGHSSTKQEWMEWVALTVTTMGAVLVGVILAYQMIP
jgi:hypothetical protein